jgi:tetratricopeptide (TPR) repeat protein
MLAGLPYVPAVSWLSNPLAWEPAGPRFFTATVVQGLALLQQAVPHGLLIDYGPHSIGIQRSPLAPGYLVCGTLLLLLAILCVASARRRPLLFAGLAALLGFAFPTSNLLLPIGTIFGERLCYAPSLGVALLVAAAVQRWPRRREVWIALLLWLGWSAVLLLARHADYSSNEELHRADAARNPASLKLQMDVAAFDTQHGAVELARQRIAAVTEREPRLPEGWIKLGALLIDLQRPTEGIAALRRALVTPFVREREDTPRIYHLIGLAQRRIGQGEEAWLTLREAHARDPRNVAIIVDQLDAAVDGSLPQREVDAILAKLQQLDPEHPAGYFHRGRQEARLQRWAGAELLLRRSLERWRSPDAPLQVVVALAEAIHAQGRRQEAIEMLEAFRKDPRLRPNQLQRVEQVLQRLPR